MGKFTNTQIESTVNSLEIAQRDRLSGNPFYAFLNSAPTVVTFYNINKNETSLDIATQNINAQVNSVSGLRFDKIYDVLLYGVPKFDVDLDIGEFGTESSPIEGEVVLPPNTFEPYPESFFTINYLQTKKILFFRVIKVNTDTLPNGANFYKINFTLDNFDLKIDNQVVREFKFISDNISNGYKSVIESTKYDMISSLENTMDDLKSFYINLFFKSNVQTLVYKYGEWACFFYDPYIIQFIIKNNILYNAKDKYTYISHACILPLNFSIDYANSFFGNIEKKDSKLKEYNQYAVLVTDPMSLLTTRMEDYYMVTCRDELGNRLYGEIAEPVDQIDMDLLNMIKNKTRITDQTNPKFYYNIIYDYFFGTIDPKTIDMVYNINFVPCKELYYSIPIIIYIVNNYIESLVKDDKIDTL
jgi:hypothetical protein